MQFEIEKRGPRGVEMHRQFVQIRGDQIIGSSSWRNPDGKREDRYVVLTIRDDKIADMQVCGTRREALRFAKRNR